MKEFKDLSYSEYAETKLDLYIPEKEEFDLMIFFHGGGIESGDKKDEEPFRNRIISEGYAFISANYRMYPGAKFPEFILDAAAAVDWARCNVPNYGKLRRVYVGGSSAGAYLTAMLAYNPEYLGKYGIKTTDISGYIINSAQMTTHFNVLRERGMDTRRIVADTAAPVYYINENTDFPNVLIVVSDDDMPCRYEQNIMFVRTLRHFECPEDKIELVCMKGFTHCGYDDTKEYADTVLKFMRK